MFTLEELRIQAPLLKAGLRYEYDHYINSPAWKKKREKVLRRDNYTCQVHGCGATDNLQVHHLTYKHVFRESLAELTTVCSFHHGIIHGGIVGRNNKVVRKVKKTRFREPLEVTA